MIEFGTFATAFATYEQKGAAAIPPGLGFEDFYSHVEDNLRAKGAEEFYRFSFGFECERRWYASNAPEFKVYPAMCDAMEATSVEIDSRYFKMPYQTFLIRFPKHHIRDEPIRDKTGKVTANAPWLASAIITMVEEPLARSTKRLGSAAVAISGTGDPDVRKLVIFLCFETAQGDPSQFNYFKFPLLDGRTLMQTYASTYMRADGKSPTLTFGAPASVDQATVHDLEIDGGYWPSRALYSRVLPIAVGTAFFGIGKDRQQRIVTPEKTPRHERRRIAKETGQKTRDVESRPIYSVGKDVILPRYAPDPQKEKAEHAPDALCVRPGCEHRYDQHTAAKKGCEVEECGCATFDTGRHLTRGYIRCGHLHYYCVGPRKNGQPGTDYELRWVDPTPVRPDLGIAPVRSRAIRTPRNEIISADLERLQES